jgi:hypothetical protein
MALLTLPLRDDLPLSGAPTSLAIQTVVIRSGRGSTAGPRGDGLTTPNQSGHAWSDIADGVEAPGDVMRRTYKALWPAALVRHERSTGEQGCGRWITGH